MELPLYWRTMSNETLLLSTLPLVIGVSVGFPSRPGVESFPLNCEPSAFSERTDSRGAPPLRPGLVQIQLPSASAARTTDPARSSVPATKLNRDMIFFFIGL